MRTKDIDNLVDDVKKHANEKIMEAKEGPSTKNLIPTGSTTFNLACSDNPTGGFGLGKIVNLIGDSSSGKTFIALTIFAEAARKKRFRKYDFYYDDVENANAFDMEHLFGAKAAARIKPPRVDNEGEDLPSETIQDFFENINRLLEKETPFIYVLDSFDALTSEEEQKKVEETMEARRHGRKAAGSYGMEKPKIITQILRMIKGKIKRTKSLVIIISQTRDNIDPMSFSKKTRSGGRALRFYSSHEIWTAVGGNIKARGQKIGIVCKGKITKNKLTGKLREFEFPIYYSYGVDDIQSCVDFLIRQRRWWKKGQRLVAKGLSRKPLKREKLIRFIEQKGLEKQLRAIVAEEWMKEERRVYMERKPKYD